MRAAYVSLVLLGILFLATGGGGLVCLAVSWRRWLCVLTQEGIRWKAGRKEYFCKWEDVRTARLEERSIGKHDFWVIQLSLARERRELILPSGDIFCARVYSAIWEHLRAQGRYDAEGEAALMAISCHQLYEWKTYYLSDAQKAAGDGIPLHSENNRDYDHHMYALLEEGSRLTALRQKPAIQFTRDYPRLDGATAFFPIYAAAARAIYLEPEEWKDEKARNEAIRFSRTPNAYKNLISGDVDIIFALAPSQNQQKHAADNGLTLRLTPIAREAFVFLVNAQNPVTNLSLAEVRAIYSGKIDNWREVGGKNKKIIPFQRPEDSGSQTILLQKVMQGESMRKPMREVIEARMDALLNRVADYRNLGNAIGYSFRFYVQEMYPVSGIRLLSMDGIAPTPENIRTQRYPLTVDIYMVTARPLSGNAQKLHDWFLSPEGQQLIEDVGYVPIAPTQ
jgi:phosphate transport system substrate-binding protein